MAVQGPNNGGTFTATGGGKPWLNPSDAQTSNDGHTTCDLDGGADDTSQALQVTNFGFSVPGGSTIDGIVVEIERHQIVIFGGSAEIHDNTVKLMKGGTAQGDDKASLTIWPDTDAYVSYGSSVDKWGLSWSAADINGSGFGIQMGIINPSVDDSTGFIDHVRITVYYTEGATGQQASVSKQVIIV